MNLPKYMPGTPTVLHYGCVECQRYHRQFDPEFGPHLFRQSKHGYEHIRATPGEEIRVVFRMECGIVHQHHELKREL